MLVALLCGCRKPAPVEPVAQVPDLAVAAPAPLDVTTLDGKRAAFSTYTKKVTFIALWATFCKPCMDELPMVQALAKKLEHDPDVSVVAVSADEVESDADRAHVAEVAKHLGLTLPVLVDDRGILARRYSVAFGAKPGPLIDGDADLSLPTTVVQLADGRYTRKQGFEVGMKLDRYVAKHVELVAAAKLGTLEPEVAELSDEAAAEMAAETSTIELPAMSPAEYRRSWPAVRARLQKVAHLSADKLAAAERQAKSGTPIRVELPDTAGKK